MVAAVVEAVAVAAVVEAVVEAAVVEAEPMLNADVETGLKARPLFTATARMVCEAVTVIGVE